MFILGLTGGIAMGKTTVANIFRQLNIPVFDADKTVHLLMLEKEIIKIIEKNFPNVTQNNQINHEELGKRLYNNMDNLAILENIIHPHLNHNLQLFTKINREDKQSLIVLDIPLLFEKGLDQHLDIDAVAIVSAPIAIQKSRALTRLGMSEELFENICKRQMPNEEKILRADYIISTATSLNDTKKEVENLVSKWTVK